jgi:hypothetical protein
MNYELLFKFLQYFLKVLWKEELKENSNTKKFGVIVILIDCDAPDVMLSHLYPIEMNRKMNKKK